MVRLQCVWTAAILLGCAISVPAQGGSPPKAVIDRVVAVVNGEMISLSDLRFEAAVALVRAGGVEAATASLDDDALQAALQYAIAERLEVREADKLQAFSPDPGELEQAVQSFKQKFPSSQALELFLERFELDESHLRGVLARSLRAAKLLDSRVRLRAQVAEADVRRFYEQHASELGPYPSARAQITEKLMRERYARLAAREVAQLRTGADIRILASFPALKEGS